MQAILEHCPSYEPARLFSATTVPAGDARSVVTGIGPISSKGQTTAHAGQRPVSSQMPTTTGSTTAGQKWRNTLVNSLGSTQGVVHEVSDILRSNGPLTVKA